MRDILTLNNNIVFGTFHEGTIEIIPKGTPCTIQEIADLFFIADVTIDGKVYELSCYNTNLSLNLVIDESANNHMGGRRRRMRTRRMRTRRMRTRHMRTRRMRTRRMRTRRS